MIKNKLFTASNVELNLHFAKFLFQRSVLAQDICTLIMQTVSCSSSYPRQKMILLCYSAYPLFIYTHQQVHHFCILEHHRNTAHFKHKNGGCINKYCSLLIIRKLKRMQTCTNAISGNAKLKFPLHAKKRALIQKL